MTGKSKVVEMYEKESKDQTRQISWNLQLLKTEIRNQRGAHYLIRSTLVER